MASMAMAAVAAKSASLALSSRGNVQVRNAGQSEQLPVKSLHAKSSSAQPLFTVQSVAVPRRDAMPRSVTCSAAESATQTASTETATVYHFLVANAKFMLDEEEHFQEQLKERLRWLGEQKREQDFWLLYEPAFLDSFPEITKRLKRPAVALVSTDAIWMTFMKLRLDRVLKGEFESDSVDAALESKKIDISFEKPANWVAPYPKYEADWWKPYVPAKYQ